MPINLYVMLPWQGQCHGNCLIWYSKNVCDNLFYELNYTIISIQVKYLLSYLRFSCSFVCYRNRVNVMEIFEYRTVKMFVAIYFMIWIIILFRFKCSIYFHIYTLFILLYDPCSTGQWSSYRWKCLHIYACQGWYDVI